MKTHYAIWVSVNNKVFNLNNVTDFSIDRDKYSDQELYEVNVHFNTGVAFWREEEREIIRSLRLARVSCELEAYNIISGILLGDFSVKDRKQIPDDYDEEKDKAARLAENQSNKDDLPF